MRALIQRVTSGKVTVEGKTVAEIGHGLVILLGIGQGDTEEQARFLAQKIATLRIFEDSAEKFNLSLLDASGEAIVVSQFTLYGDARKGHRPSFSEAARPELAAAARGEICCISARPGRPIKDRHLRCSYVG
jgi:D-tyrosyl-tRNA(Tyr) deacylase